MTYTCLFGNVISSLLPRIFQNTLIPQPSFNYIAYKVLSPWYRWPNWGHKVKWFIEATKKSNIREQIHFKKPHNPIFTKMKIGKWLEQQKIRKSIAFSQHIKVLLIWSCKSFLWMKGQGSSPSWTFLVKKSSINC